MENIGEKKTTTQMFFPAFFPSLARLSIGPGNYVTDDQNTEATWHGFLPQNVQQPSVPTQYSPGYSHTARSKTGDALHQQQPSQPAASSLLSSQKAADSLYNLAGVSPTTTSGAA